MTYAAGLFDGEGSVIINKTNAKTHTLAVTMHLTHEEAITRLCRRFGGSLNTVKRIEPRCRQMFSWRATGEAAEAFLVAVRRHLIIKRPQADLALEFYRTRKNLHHLKPEDRPAEVARREDFKRRLQLLNGKTEAELDALAEASR